MWVFEVKWESDGGPPTSLKEKQRVARLTLGVRSTTSGRGEPSETAWKLYFNVPSTSHTHDFPSIFFCRDYSEENLQVLCTGPQVWHRQVCIIVQYSHACVFVTGCTSHRLLVRSTEDKRGERALRSAPSHWHRSLGLLCLRHEVSHTLVSRFKCNISKK